MQRHIERLPQATRFLLAGGFAALITWLVRFPLSHIVPFAAAVALASAVGMVFGFVAYRHFVFPGSDRVIGHQLWSFVVVNILSMIVVVVVSEACAKHLLPLAGLGWQVEGISHAIGIAAGAVSNYFGHKHFSFAK